MTHNKELKLTKPSMMELRSLTPVLGGQSGEIVNKADHERDVFLEFALAAGLDIDRESVQPEEPPHPDISCLVAGTRRYFELTRAANQEIANEVGYLLAEARRTRETGVGQAHAYNDEVSLRAAVARKAASIHETGGAPLDLIVYYDGVFLSRVNYSCRCATTRLAGPGQGVEKAPATAGPSGEG